MARKLPKKDVVIIGLGWTGSILANELTDEGLDVVAIERGPWRDAPTDFPTTFDQDELRYRIRHELFLRPEQTTFTFRNKMSETALPIRDWGAFMPPTGVGGGGVHWNAETWRFLPSDFVLKTHLTQRYGAGFLPDDMTIQDWGVTYDDLEPHYDRFEYLCGTSGAGRQLQGQDPRRRQSLRGAALAALSQSAAGPAVQPHAVRQGRARARLQAVSAAVRQHVAGLHEPARRPARTLHLLRLLRMVRLRQLFQGHSADHDPAGAGAQIEFQLRDECEVTRINVDGSGKRATGVTFVDTSGEEWEQPADLVILSAFTIFNVQLLLLSGIGKPYDPVANQGVIGRNFTHQTISDVIGFFDKEKFNFNPFIASGAIGMCIDEFNGDNFDHGPLGFVGGGYMGQVQTDGRPIETTPVPPGTPRWGANGRGRSRTII